MKKLYSFLTIGCSFTLRIFPLVFLTILFGQSASAQSCPIAATTNILSYPNTYFPAGQNTVSAGSTSVKVSAAYYGTTPISVGDILLIIQMQGAQINSSNNSSYGDGSGSGGGYLNNGQLMAGNMEYVVATNNLSTAGGTLTFSTG